MKTLTIGTTLRKIRHARKLTINDVEEATKGVLTYQSIRRMEEENKTISLEKLPFLADFYGVTVTDIFKDAEGIEGIQPDLSLIKNVPVISWVQAGNWSESPSNIDDPSECDTVIAPSSAGENCFALKVSGDSMQSPSGMSFPEGCIIIVDPDRTPNHKDYIIARYEDSGESTFKQLLIDGPNKILKALNPTYPPLQINGNAMITGVVINMQWSIS